MLGISISTVVILSSFASLIAYVLRADGEYRASGKRIWMYKMPAVTAGYLLLLSFLRFSPLNGILSNGGA